MIDLKLVKHSQSYAIEMSKLTSDIRVKEALGLSDEQASLRGTKEFIDFVLAQEMEQKQLSRVIFNESNQLIGVITLKSIDTKKKTAHIGTWIGAPYWGKGYNQLAKEKMLNIAFNDMDLEYVFAGATFQNIRSQKAQMKLPYMIIDVGSQFPSELKKIQIETKSKCILNMVTKDSFFRANAIPE